MDKKKRLKRIESLKKQIEAHRKKVLHYTGRNEFTLEYWEKEIRRFEDEIKEEEDKLGRDDQSK